MLRKAQINDVKEIQKLLMVFASRAFPFIVGTVRVAARLLCL